tara:strand:+ start:241 stop:432 length:192 start_codon:yes stop_codon:yes gene_type:complete
MLKKSIIITDAKYNKIQGTDKLGSVNCVFNGQKLSIPLDEDNRHYAEIKRQVDAGELTIEDAD